jgi:H+/Cl- antiporter ClcA
MTPPPDGPLASGQTDPLELLRTRGYVMLLVFGALIGVPIAAVAYGFLRLVDLAQGWLFQTFPEQLGFSAAPWWWSIPLLAVAGLVVAAAITYLPGTGGHEPSAGLVAMGSPSGPELIGVVVAAFVTLASGAVLGPEAPLIAIGGGLAALAVRTVKRDAPAQASLVIGAAGSFAAISTLLGSPIVGAFLLMEVAGLAGPMVGVVLAPGLLAAGVGSLVFLGLNDITGWGTFSLGIPELPPFQAIEVEQFLWAIAIGLIGAALGTLIKRGATWATPRVAGSRMLATPLLGVAVALCAVAFDAVTDRGVEQVLFSGENTLAPLIQQADSWTVGALALLILCKSVAYLLSLSAFRGGPTFPAMFIGAALGVALSHLPGLPMVAGVAMGIGALAVTMLRLPLTSVLLTVLFLQSDGVSLMPLVIVAVVVAYVASVRFTPAPAVEPVPAT